MPASLDEAFSRSYASNSETMTSLSSLKNPDYNTNTNTNFSSGSNRSYWNISDIQSEADDIASTYSSIQSNRLTTNNQLPTNNVLTNQLSTNNVLTNPTNLSTNQSHDCNMLIAKLLSCRHCRSKIKTLLSDDNSTIDENTNTNTNTTNQTGGNNMETKPLLINIAFGILLILVLDGLFNLKK